MRSSIIGYGPPGSEFLDGISGKSSTGLSPQAMDEQSGQSRLEVARTRLGHTPMGRTVEDFNRCFSMGRPILLFICVVTTE